MEPKVSLPCPEEPAISPCRKPDASNILHPTLFSEGVSTPKAGLIFSGNNRGVLGWNLFSHPEQRT
jgi:hypothetical protein